MQESTRSADCERTITILVQQQCSTCYHHNCTVKWQPFEMVTLSLSWILGTPKWTDFRISQHTTTTADKCSVPCFRFDLVLLCSILVSNRDFVAFSSSGRLYQHLHTLCGTLLGSWHCWFRCYIQILPQTLPWGARTKYVQILERLPVWLGVRAQLL